VLTRGQRLLLAFSSSLLGALALVFLVEWEDPKIRRSQDLARVMTPDSIISIPSLPQDQWTLQSPVYLSPLSEAITQQIQSKGSALVQFVSPTDGDGKTAISSAVAQILSQDRKVCLIHQVRTAAGMRTSQVIASGDYYVMDVSMSEPLAQRLPSMAKDYGLILIDTDSVAGLAPSSTLIPNAEIVCVLVSAGHTSRHYFRSFKNEIQRFPDQRLVFILNRNEDPLPRWLQPH
jgi:hypothetical protein